MDDQNLIPPHSSELASGHRSLSMWMHLTPLLAFFASFLFPIPFLPLIATVVLYYSQKDKNEFVNSNGKESLNFQITLALVTVVMLIVVLFTFGGSILSMIAGGLGDSDAVTGVGILGLVGSSLLIGLLFMAIGIFSLVVMMIGTIRANNGKVYRYPLSLRLVK